MKLIKCIFLSLGLSYNSFAQQFAIVHFQVDDQLVYMIQKAEPGSLLEFYSARSGGKLLFESKADEAGSLRIEQPLSFRPAFTLNRLTGNPPVGKGVVQFIEEPEFCFQHFEVKHDVAGNSVSWDLSFSKTEGYSVALERSTNGRNFLLSETIAINGRTHYSSIDHTNGFVIYRLRIVNSTKGIDYVSKEIQVGSEAFRIYPVPARDRVTIETAEGISNYSVYNSSGVKVLEAAGSKHSLSTTIDVQYLPSGTYFLEAKTKNDKEIFCKIAKQ